MARIALSSATNDLASRDPNLARLIELAGPLRYPPRSADGPFGALARTIVFQQLAGRAAQAILNRVITAVGGDLTAEAIVATADEPLREAGLSRNKLSSLRDLSVKSLDGTIALPPPPRLTDEDVITRLTSVRGIGRWTAQMFLIFELRRLDVWPVDDLGVRQGYAAAWHLDHIPTPKELVALGDPFRPYRSLVARYCWQAAALAHGGSAPARP